MQPLAERMRPSSFDQYIGQEHIIGKNTALRRNLENEIVPSMIFWGPPGVGKTSLALALANTFGWDVVELNASDQRSWSVIKRIVGEAVFNETIDDEGYVPSSRGKHKLIILDEVDNISKKEDSGGETALIRLLKKKPRQPMVLTANDPYKLSSELRNLCDFIPFKRLRSDQIVKVLEKICAEEGIKASRDVLIAIAKNSGGDLRASINDLQAIAQGKDEITIEDVVIAKRTQETDVFKVMQKIS